MTPSRAPSKAKKSKINKQKSVSKPFSIKVKEHGLEAVLGAAYLMMDRAYVALGGNPKTVLTVELTPKAGFTRKDVEAAFLAELATQKVRWKLAQGNLPVREHVAELAVRLANGQLPPEPAADEAPADQLTDEQRKEIEKLIAEVEDEIKTMNAKKSPAAADPKNIKASWEEKQEAKTRGGQA